MKLAIVTPKGITFEGEVEHIVVQGNSGQLAIFHQHVPIVVPIQNGFIKRVIGTIETYTVISGGLLEQSNNLITVIAQEASEGHTLDEAKAMHLEVRQNRLHQNRKQAMDFSEMERDLALNLREIQASKL